MVLATRTSAPNTSLAVIRPKPRPDSPTASEISDIMLKSELPHEAPNPVSKKMTGGWVGRSVELYAAVLEHPIPAVQFLAHEGFELLRRTARGADAGFFELFGDHGVGIHLDDFPLNLVDDTAWGAGRRHKSDPGRNVVEGGNARLDGKRPDLGQRRQRPAVELCKRPQFSSLDEGQ